MKIQLVSIYVHDPTGKALAFYTETLGFIENTYAPQSQMVSVVSADDPKGPALLLKPSDSQAIKAFQKELREKNLPALVISAGDVQAEYQRLLQRGVQFTQIPMKTEAGDQAVFDDTCGNLIQIVQIN